MSSSSVATDVPETTYHRLHRLAPVIMKEWEERLREKLPAAKDQPPTKLRNSVPLFLDALCAELKNTDTSEEGSSARLAKLHGETRSHDPEYSLSQVLLEYHLLRKVILETLGCSGPLREKEREVINDAIDFAIASAGEAFVAGRQRQDSIAKTFVELFSTASTSIVGDDANRSDHLQRLLGALNESADSEFSILLVADDKQNMLLGACSGLADLEPSDLQTLGNSQLKVDAIASSQSVGSSHTQLEPSLLNFLNRQGCKSILANSIEANGRVAGVLFLGFLHGYPLEPRALTIIEDFSKRLVYLLENIRLFDLSQNDFLRLKDEAKLREQFVSTLSHDLRNPLAGARLAAQLLSRLPTTSAQSNQLSIRIVRALDRADRLVENLLDASRLKAGKRIPLQTALCDLKALLTETVDDLTFAYGDRFVLEVSEQISSYLGRDQIRRAVENLANNAVKYGDPESAITIRAYRQNDEVVLEVRNFGNPIPWDQTKSIFTPYFRSISAESGNIQGWGLGLPLVKAVIEGHGGRVLVESSAQLGTVFSMIFPLDCRPFEQKLMGSDE